MWPFSVSRKHFYNGNWLYAKHRLFSTHKLLASFKGSALFAHSHMAQWLFCSSLCGLNCTRGAPYTTRSVGMLIQQIDNIFLCEKHCLAAICTMVVVYHGSYTLDHIPQPVVFMDTSEPLHYYLVIVYLICTLKACVPTTRFHLVV